METTLLVKQSEHRPLALEIQPVPSIYAQLSNYYESSSFIFIIAILMLCSSLQFLIYEHFILIFIIHYFRQTTKPFYFITYVKIYQLTY